MGDVGQWWQSRWFLVAVTLLMAVPLLLPATPPLVDLPGHLGRYRVQLDIASSPELQRYFEFQWQLIGNLGVDLMIVPLAPAIGLEPAVKLIVLSIPVLTTAGILWTAKEAHGEIPPTTFFAVPLACGFPFNFGFVNFALSMALALLAFPLWLRLGRQGRTRWRVLLFIPLSCLLWVVHAFGCAVLCLMVWSAELVRNRDDGASWARSVVRAGAAAAMLVALPLLLMVLWRGDVAANQPVVLPRLSDKIYALATVLQDRWIVWDILGLVFALAMIAAALLSKRFAFSNKLAFAALVLAVLFLLLPHRIFGSVFADNRLLPYVLMMSLMAIRFAPGAGPTLMRITATLALLFLLLRVGSTAWSFGIADQEMKSRLAALDYVPEGAAVLSLVGDSCAGEWPMPRYWHIGSFVIVRRLGFSNDQWQLPGAQLLRVKYDEAGKFAADPSEAVHPSACLADVPPKLRAIARTTDEALARFPRSAFDYVWLVRAPDFEPGPKPGLTLVWRGADSVLYKVEQSEK